MDNNDENRTIENVVNLIALPIMLLTTAFWGVLFLFFCYLVVGVLFG